jgi:uroporphyrinogen decarboxylase
MNKRERVIHSLKHKQPDITPYHIDFTIPAREKLEGHYPHADIDAVIGNHLLRLRPAFQWTEIRPGFWRDAFGVVWDRRTDQDIGNPAEYPLSDKKNLDSYRFPEIKPELFSHIPEAIKKNPDRFAVFCIGVALFERAWTLRGMENLMMDMVDDPDFVEALLDRIIKFNLLTIQQVFGFPLQMIYFGDDWGQQRGLLMGPKYWRKYIKPGLERMFRKVKEKGLFISIHSCGDIEEILPDLIEIGLDLYNPFQPEVADINRIKKEFGDRLSFWGGLSIQKILPFGTPEEVKKEVKRLIKEIGAGGGYILAPAHATPKDVPLANILAMIEILQNQS